MPKTPRVVPITEPIRHEKPTLVARDEKTQRVIIGIGSQRIAFDISTRITHLPPYTGDRPAPVLPMTQNAALQHDRGPGTSAQDEAKKPAQTQSPRGRKKSRPA